MIKKEIEEAFEPIIKNDLSMLKLTKEKLKIFNKKDCFVVAYGSTARMAPAKEVDYQVFFDKGHKFTKEEIDLATPDKGCSSCKLKDITELKRSYQISLRQVTRIIDFTFLLGNKKTFDKLKLELAKSVLKKKSTIILLNLLNHRKYYYDKKEMDIKRGIGGKRDLDYMFFMENIMNGTMLNAPNNLIKMNKNGVLQDEEVQSILEFYKNVYNNQTPTKELREKISNIYLKYAKNRVIKNLALKTKSTLKEVEDSLEGKYCGKSKELQFSNEIALARLSDTNTLENLLNKSLKKITLKSWGVLMNIAMNDSINEDIAKLMARKLRHNISLRHIRIALIKNKSVPNYIKQEMLKEDPCKISLQNAIINHSIGEKRY